MKEIEMEVAKERRTKRWRREGDADKDYGYEGIEGDEHNTIGDDNVGKELKVRNTTTIGDDNVGDERDRGDEAKEIKEMEATKERMVEDGK